MRGILLLIGLLLSISVFAQSRVEMRLNGKVKSIKEEYRKCPMIALEGGQLNCYERSTSYNFNKEGNLVLEEQKVSDDGYIIEKINTKEGYTLVKSLEWDGVKRKSFEEYYNKKGVKIKVVNYNNSGEVANIWEYSYDKNQRLTQTKTTNIWNNVITIYEHWLNKYGDIVLSKEFKNGALVNEESFEINYTFDKKGNWLTKVFNSQYSESYKRIIQYY
ncbi:hypothetical protein H1R17_02900 [Flavobacterium sp. xlx-214]|uniref:hypothetical protein n=1 Tax=unclassified Flavobacterium TaxID=196869 RepID=UPI0013D210A6|nr:MULTISPECIES: hypothetical protein [unclassified Flavobacterium]MBA5793337.1 hypothetical protein [Flavobacterium sp. xlx-221]QMI84100.1 hypothetical protein H1R17_02900 [Flavobacterium sp. xlx-214]